MSIKKRITVWYGIMIAYFQVRKSVRTSEQESLLDAAEKIAAEVTDSSTGKVKIPDGYRISTGMAAVINTSNGKILADNSGMEWISQEPYRYNTYWTYQNGTDEWVVYDHALIQDENRKINAIIRVCIQENRRAFRTVMYAMVAGSCMFLFMAVTGGYLILSRALKPLADMTETAGMIEKGNLKKRIALSETEDEVSVPGRALNAMLDRLEEAIRRERQFASDASHELKTPVAVIMDAGEQLLRHTDPSEKDTCETGQMIVQESRRMNNIISQLLVLTRGDTGKSHLEIEKVNLCDVVKNVMEELKERADDSGIRLEFLSGCDFLIEADQTMITQVFMNLIENAIKYGKRGGFVRVTMSEKDQAAVVRIEDNGIGISGEDLPHIFERFYRADRSRNRTGTGLGLSIVKQMIEMHGGTIDAESRPEEGTVFTLKLNKKMPQGNDKDAVK